MYRHKKSIPKFKKMIFYVKCGIIRIVLGRKFLASTGGPRDRNNKGGNYHGKNQSAVA